MTWLVSSSKHLMKKLYHLYKLSENTGGKFIHYWSEYKRVQCFGNHYGISEKIKPVLPCKPAIPLLSIYPREVKAQRSISNVIHESQNNKAAQEHIGRE